MKALFIAGRLAGLLALFMLFLPGCQRVETGKPSPCQDSTYLALLHKPIPLTDNEARVFLALSDSCEEYRSEEELSPLGYIILGTLFVVGAFVAISVLTWAYGQDGH